MAIAIENASIGTPVTLGTSSTTVALTTNVTIAAGSTVAVFAAGTGASISSCADNSGNGYTWTVDVSNSQGAPNVGIATVYATAGLASGTVITVTYSQATNVRQLAGVSWTGGASSSRLDQTATADAFGSGAPWASGSITPTVSGTIVLGFFSDFGSSTDLASTPDSGWTELTDLFNDDMNTTAVYQIVANTSARNPSGTYSPASGVGDQAGVTANYKAGAGGTDATVTAAVSTATAAVVAPPLPRPTPPFTEINVRM